MEEILTLEQIAELQNKSLYEIYGDKPNISIAGMIWRRELIDRVIKRFSNK
jgi:hypothetical protein